MAQERAPAPFAVPLPACPYESLPGLARASASMSASVLNGELAGTSRMFGDEPISEIGVKSSKPYGIFV